MDYYKQSHNKTQKLYSKFTEENKISAVDSVTE